MPELTPDEIKDLKEAARTVTPDEAKMLKDEAAKSSGQPLQGSATKTDFLQDVGTGIGNLVQSTGQGIQAVGKDIASPEPIQNKAGAALAGAGAGAIGVPESLVNLGAAAIHAPPVNWTGPYENQPAIAAAKKSAPGMYGAGGLAGNVGASLAMGAGVSKIPALGQAAMAISKIPAVAGALAVLNKVPAPIRSVLVGAPGGAAYNAAGSVAEQYKNEGRVHGHRVVQDAAGGAALGGGLAAVHGALPKKQPAPQPVTGDYVPPNPAMAGQVAAHQQVRGRLPYNGPPALPYNQPKITVLPSSPRGPLALPPPAIRALPYARPNVIQTPQPRPNITPLYPGHMPPRIIEAPSRPPGETAKIPPRTEFRDGKQVNPDELNQPSTTLAKGQIPPAHKSATEAPVEPAPAPQHPPTKESVKPSPIPSAETPTPKEVTQVEAKTEVIPKAARERKQYSFISPETTQALAEKDKGKASEPAPELAKKKEYTVGTDPEKKGNVAIFTPDGKIHSSSKRTLDQAQTTVDKLNAGLLKPTQGSRETYAGGTAIPHEGREELFQNAQKLPEDHPLSGRLSQLADAKHTADLKEARFNAAYDALKDNAKLVPKTGEQPAFKYDSDLEEKYIREHPDSIGVKVQGRYEYEPKAYKFPSGIDTLDQQQAHVEKLYKEAAAEDKKYRAVRSDLVEPLQSGYKRGELPRVISVEHEKQPITVRTVPTSKEFRQALAAPITTHVKRALRDIRDIGGTANKILTGAAEDISNSGHSYAIADVTAPLLQAYGAIRKAAKKEGVDLSAEALRMYLGNHTTSDKIHQFADPRFVAEYQKNLGMLDEAIRGVKTLRTGEEKAAWLRNRYSSPDEIRMGDNDADMLSREHQEALIKQNEGLDNMSDLFEQYLTELNRHGYTEHGIKTLIPGGNNLARALSIDLEHIDPRAFHGERWGEHAAGHLTNNLYRMMVTGNWHISGLHFLEAGTVGLSAHPASFIEGTALLNTDKAVQQYVNSMDASTGILKRVKETTEGSPGNLWRKVQVGAVNKVGNLFGKENLHETIAKNETANKAGNLIEGVSAETQKVHVMRATALVRAAKDMKYEGGATQLAKDFNKALENPEHMDPEKRFELAGRIVYHMNEMIGFTPAGYQDLNFFQRLADRTSPFLKLITPFTSQVTQQSRVLTKFATKAIDAAHDGDWRTAAVSVGSLSAMTGLLTLLGGRAGLPEEVQNAMHKANPELAKRFLTGMDNLAFIGKAFGKEQEHLTPKLVPALHLGESFPSQVIGQAANAIGAKDILSKARGIATMMALYELTDIGGRMGSGQILTFVKAIKEGVESKHLQWLFQPPNTVNSTLKIGSSMFKLAKAAGADVQAPKTKDYLGKAELPTNLVKSIYNAIGPGNDTEAQKYINEARDDMAFGDAIRELDPKHYSALYKAYEKMNYQAMEPPTKEELNSPDAKGAEGKQLKVDNRLHFWETHYTRIVKQLQAKHEHETTKGVENG